MNTETVFRIITILLLVCTLGIGGYFRRKADHEGGAMRSTEGERLVYLLRGLGLIAILPLFGYLINPDWVVWARFTAPDWLRWLAVLPAVSAVPFLAWVFITIGNNISPTQATRQNHKLITAGPYRYIRHPLYTGATVFFLALTVITTLWWLSVTALLPLTILLFRTSIEETRLIETFGDDYRNYMKRTGRFLPKLG